jgi:methionyl aminopeptidase
MAIIIKTPQEIEKMRVSGIALRKVHDALAPHVKAGVSTMDLEEIAVAKIAELGGKAAFKGYHGYPSALCTSMNEEVVHGMPNAKRILKEGDILSIDCGVIIDGFYSDAAVTYPIGKVEPRTEKLLKVTKASLEAAISRRQCRRCARARVSASSVNLSAMGSAAACTKTPSCRTSAARERDPG